MIELASILAALLLRFTGLATKWHLLERHSRGKAKGIGVYFGDFFFGAQWTILEFVLESAAYEARNLLRWRRQDVCLANIKLVEYDSSNTSGANTVGHFLMIALLQRQFAILFVAKRDYAKD